MRRSAAGIVVMIALLIVVADAQTDGCGTGIRVDQQAMLTAGSGALTFLESGGQFGWSVAAGDVNGDGVADLVVGARKETGGATGEGGVHILIQ